MAIAPSASVEKSSTPIAPVRAAEVHDSFVRSLLDSIPEGLVVIDQTGRILAFSRAACEMFDYTEDEVLGRNVSMLMPPAEAAHHDDYIRAYLMTGRKRIIGIGRRVMARHKLGHDIPARLEIGEATISGTQLFLGYLRDVSEREEQRRKLKMVNEQLARASRISSMGMLAGAIAHEINQPLTAIQNYVETCAALVSAEGPLDRETLRDTMETCSQETARAGEIIRRFRHFMASGETEPARESLSKLINDALVLMLAGGEGTDVQIKIELDESCDDVLGDGIQIQQVVYNLARNALEAMAGLENRILQITSVCHAKMIEVTVEDSGPGLDEDHRKRLFTPFGTSKIDGMGLGLSISQTIIEGHGGRLWPAASALGGAAMHFTVPRMAETGQTES
ncbi:sensor histidine kinase [Novosphingobium sp.]|uniref:sensor histidine kinase n=1 Tax=Novosphingobium sp. TaxID=1874826 RepID=UPI0025EA38F5|nr:PAS domain S-box protein [Novosphingobium sp.]